jgi:hypothetical protein
MLLKVGQRLMEQRRRPSDIGWARNALYSEHAASDLAGLRIGPARVLRANKIVKTEEVERIIEKQVDVPVEVIREVVQEVPVEKVVTVVHEVVKQVPVDRIVPVEKPVEVKVKELIYVPIFTNDPDVLKGQLA